MRKKRKLCLLLTMYLLLCFTLPVFAATNNFITTNNYIPGTHNIAPVTTRASGNGFKLQMGVGGINIRTVHIQSMTGNILMVNGITLIVRAGCKLVR